MDLVIMKCFGAGAIGILIHSLMKANELKKDAFAANMPFNWKENYWKIDNLVIIMSFLSVVLWWLVFGEMVKLYTLLEEYIITSYFLVGGVGSYAVQRVFGRSKKLIRNFVDSKTNMLDDILNNGNMEEFEWVVMAENTTDVAKLPEEESYQTLEEFAQNTEGTLNNKEIVYTTEPEFTQVDMMRLNTTVYTSGPVRRPTGG